MFCRQVVAELRKVFWPTQEQLVTYFFVVMVFVLFMIGLVSVLDLGFRNLSFWVFSGHASKCRPAGRTWTHRDGLQRGAHPLVSRRAH